MENVLRAAGVAALMLAIAACGSGETHDANPEPGTDAEQPSGEMERMGDMGMDGMDMMGGDMMETMRTHMDSMASMDGERMRAMVDRHRQMVANLMARFNGEMSEMGMPGDTAWSALMDSLRADLIAMPDMGAEELQTMMPEHRARVMRLMGMHESMMSEMRM